MGAVGSTLVSANTEPRPRPLTMNAKADENATYSRDQGQFQSITYEVGMQVSKENNSFPWTSLTTMSETVMKVIHRRLGNAPTPPLYVLLLSGAFSATSSFVSLRGWLC